MASSPSLPVLEARLGCCLLLGPWQAQWSAHCMPTLTHICPTLLGFPRGFANAERLIGPNSLICRALPPHLRPAGKHLLQEPSHHPIAELRLLLQASSPSLLLLLKVLFQGKGKIPIHKQ